MIDEWCIEKDLEENGSGVIKVLFQHLHGRAGEYYANISQDSQCPWQDSNKVPLEFKPRLLLLDPPICPLRDHAKVSKEIKI
jgi:hypothetical protein